MALPNANEVNQDPYQATDIKAAYNAIFGSLPSGLMDPNSGKFSKAMNSVFPNTVLQTPTGEPINASQLMYMYRQGGAQQGGQTGGQAQGQSTPGAATQSYLSSSSSGSGGGNMNWNDLARTYGLSSSELAALQQRGWSPDQVLTSFRQQGKTPVQGSTTSQQNAFGIKQVGSGQGYTVLQNTKGQNLAVDNAGNYFNIDAQGNHTPVSDIDAQKLGFQSKNPETQALKQMGQIDPGTEALRQQLSGSYTDPSKAAHPAASEYQSYLDTFRQVDPTEYAQRAGLATSMSSYLKSVQDQYALGSKLDPVTQMQVEQQARAAQAARGNLYGSGQGAVEAMTTGQAGQALQQQRLANLQGALGNQQSYLGAGLGLGDTAMNLYQQGLANKAQAQQGALSYLTSGATPYAAGQTYLSNAEGAAGNAAQGGPMYNPAALGASYTGSAGQAPQYGLDVGAQAQNWYNSLSANQGYGGAPSRNRGASAAAGAASGALGGAATGATVGSAFPGVGTLVGAGVGAVAGGALGGASGYYS